ncbi:MAG: hypothetical protein CO141_01665 [Candidatus Moranbacteria bacterium CG_4_9_14_3_um_filter_42_9]|nr:MAG: hypothetical protein CO141_01665 [Candidatus Moranbacteria bacterium CG_4_9_14_3_um_filter_42_9]
MHFAAGNPINNQNIYMDRMAKSLKEKLKIIRFLPKDAKTVLDVGCADGSVTIAMAELFPWINFLGVDLNEAFIDKAKENSKHLKNINFEKVYLRELLTREAYYDAIVFLLGVARILHIWRRAVLGFKSFG